MVSGSVATSASASVSTISLHAAEIEALRSSFGEDGANLAEVKRQVLSVVLPRIKDALGWKAIRAAKGRVNDWRTVEKKYNSLFHRDRHIYGEAKPSQLHSAATQNLSAVVYLDRSSRLEYIEGSAVALPEQSTAHRELVVAEGTIVVFPSCLIHRAAASEESKRRRTIVLFDLEDASEASPVRHDIILCPSWTQKPLLHNVYSGEEVEAQMLHDLLENRPYFWRFYRRGELRRTHWQVTAVTDAPVAADGDGDAIVPYNTSFYLLGGLCDYPSHVRVHDHRSTLRYLFNLVLFHLGYQVIS